MMKESKTPSQDWAHYYDTHDILDEITEEEIDLSLVERLRADIRSGKRRRKLKNITLKIDPLQVQAIKKLATLKSMPYQTLIRHWLAEDLREELDLVAK
jgi:predicted DNA binding CopG/RHH family protein